MKSYPSISKNLVDSSVYLWDKLDGSNIRAEYSSKNGFYKFGSRHVLIDEKTPVFGESISLIKQVEPQLIEIFKSQKYSNVVAFFEFYGENSFAGNHKEEPYQIKLIDINVFKVGMLDTREFNKLFKDTGLLPKLLHVGKVNQTMIDAVKESRLEGMTFEGVVAKSNEGMFKIKSNAWLQKLKEFCKDDDKLYRTLE
jgi:peroxiredoxin family protein